MERFFVLKSGRKDGQKENGSRKYTLRFIIPTEFLLCIFSASPLASLLSSLILISPSEQRQKSVRFLAEMFINELCHLEHRNLALSAEYFH
jgi:hypothetical protein